MNTQETQDRVQLKALIVYCCPESGNFFPLEARDFPAFFARPDVAISYSSRSKGWARKLAHDFRVWNEADEAGLILRLNSYDLLLVHPLSLNSLAKFALGIQDSFPSRIFFEAAALGKPILLNDQFVPGLDNEMNPHLVRIYRQHWERILSGTVAAFNLDNLEETATRILRHRSRQNVFNQSANRRFITREDIILAAESLEPLRLPTDAIVTDLAREEAKARGVIIIQN